MTKKVPYLFRTVFFPSWALGSITTMAVYTFLFGWDPWYLVEVPVGAASGVYLTWRFHIRKKMKMDPKRLREDEVEQV